MVTLTHTHTHLIATVVLSPTFYELKFYELKTFYEKRILEEIF